MSGNIWGKYRRAILLSAAVSMLSTSIEGMCGQGEANPLIPFMAVTGKPSREFVSEFLYSQLLLI